MVERELKFEPVNGSVTELDIDQFSNYFVMDWMF